MSFTQSSMSNTSAIPSSSLGSSQALPAGNPSNALNRISARDLTEAQIRMLSASQCLHLTDQLDQELLSLMQSLDGHFLRATGIITEKILPNVEKYGENSRDIWEAVKYFKTFFEVAAGIRLTDPTAQPDEEHEGSFQDVFNNSQASESDTTLQEADTSAAHAKFSEEPSLFEKLQQDAREQFGIEADMSSTPLTPQANGKRQRMRDLSFDSPDNSFAETVDTVPEPELQTMNFGLGKLGHAKLKDAPEPTPKISKGKQRAFEEPSTVKPSARTSTPAKPKSRDLSPSRLSAQMPEGWSAKKPTDLSKTPLTSQSSRSYYAPSNISDISSPPTMSYKFSHLPTQIARTPGKTAAQWMTQDVLETAALQMGDHRTESMLESPVIEPPSVIKNWDKRNYGGMADSPLQRPKQPDFGRVIDDDDNDDEGDDHTQVNDDVSFGSIGDAPIEDWDAGERSGMTVGGEDEDENESGHLSEQLDSKLGMEEEEDSFDIRQEAPDTLFGGNRDAGQLDKLGAFLKRGGAADMHTLHGGQLLESQPFESSPLQGRDVRHGL